MSLMRETTFCSALESMFCWPSSGMIFQPFRDPKDFLMLKETSWASAVTAGPRRKPSGHGLEHLRQY